MKCKYFVFRNFTIEPLFNKITGCRFSGYGDISFEKECSHYIWFYQLPFKFDSELLASEIDYFSKQLEFLSSQLPSGSTLFCFTLNDWFGYKPVSGDTRLQSAIYRYNMNLFGLSETDKRVQVIDINEFTQRYSLKELFDARHYYMAQVIINPKLSTAFSEWFLQKVQIVTGTRKKCLVLDLDNTLWGGVLGENGVEGIALGNTYPGNCFVDFQELIVSLKKTGVILALCSKNNPEDVTEVFANRKEFKLSLKDFSSVRINWKDKPQNIVEIAEELNIGIDSMVFMDDSPVERAFVGQMLPELTVPDFPENVYELPFFAMRIFQRYFGTYRITEEDKKKTEQYLQNAVRQREATQYSSKEDFIKALNINIVVEPDSQLNIARIAQMSQKTNQFNLTTKRYTEADLGKMLKSGYTIWCASVKDKFGDNGITAVAIVKPENESAVIDSFILSCRILGRGIEKVFLNHILNLLFEKEVKQVFAKYIPTKKNRQTENFFEENGFQLNSVSDLGAKQYETTLTEKKKISDIYKVNSRFSD